MDEEKEGMDYLSTLPQRVVTVYIPMIVFLIILLFPFYWMGVASFKSDNELLDMRTFNPWIIDSPTLENFRKLLFETNYSGWMINTVSIAIFATIISMVASIGAAYAIARIRFYGANTVGVLIFLAYLVPPSILFIPLALVIFDYGLYDTPYALILSYPTILIPFSTWLLMGYFKTIPYELEECAIIDGANRLQILTKIILPLSIPGLISAGIFAFTLCWNEFIYALTFISSSENKTVPVALLSELVTGDIYHWGALMAGALFGSIPVALVYSFFVEHYVSSMTGAVKE